MKQDARDKDPAAMDIVGNVLGRADNPGALGTYLAEEVRNITGAGCVLLVQYMSAVSGTAHRVVGVAPPRRREWAESAALDYVYDVVHRMPAARLWRGDEPSEIARLLRQEGSGVSMLFPLNAGALRLGALFVLGVPDEDRISSVRGLLNNLSAAAALALRNADIEHALDITERKRAEEAAGTARADAYNRSLIEASPDPLVTIGPDGKITDVNSATESATGYSRETLIATDFSDYFTEPEKARAGYQKVFREGMVHDYELEIRHRDGHSTPVLYNATVFRNERGETAGVFAAARDMAEHRKTESTLRKREAELNESQRLAHIGSWDWDAVNDTIWWSDEYYRIYGLDPQKPTPNYVEHLKAYTSESAGRLDRAVKQAMETGEPYELDLALAEPTASTQWIVARGEAKRDANGKIWGLRGTAQNITERKKAENELKNLNEELEQRVTAEQSAKEFAENLIQAANVIFVQLDSNGDVMRINEIAESITGYGQAEVTGRNWFELLVPKDRYPFVWEEFEKITRRGEMSDVFENPILTKTGQERHIIWKNKRVREGDKVVGTISCGIDITERKLAEAKIAEQGELLKKTIGSLTHPFYVIDAADYTILMANDAAGFDISAGGNTCYSLTHGRDEPCSGDDHLCPLEMVKKTKKPVRMEHVHYDKDGNARFFEIRGYPILDDEGNVIQMIEYALDITEQRRAEQELRRINEELDRRVKERTSELERKIAEIERINKLFVGRELRMIELKERIRELEERNA